MASDTPGRPLRAYDTAPLDTPAARATSLMVGRLTRAPVPPSAACCGPHGSHGFLGSPMIRTGVRRNQRFAATGRRRRLPPDTAGSTRPQPPGAGFA
ncbi:hypothetical protein GCM10018781_02610 [Kitasatospora indigofera]|uniref:Uncharacterized protein n=1 Tax=Kitasatospora indigofera TaxID=67307 RepID=A0A919FBP9_9ACTN|nr:hypothetical protein GCM10018781_02610 [Kitasatospora indigofera]